MSESTHRYSRRGSTLRSPPYPGRLRFGGKTFYLGGRTLIMGILNVTPDSFSGDGMNRDASAAVRRGLEMVREGADIVDVGGESTRPGATPVNAQEELDRVLPVVRDLAGSGVTVSVDTYKPEVAAEALDAGADAINDVMGLRDRRMATAISERNAGVVIMHMKGLPKTMQKEPTYPRGVVREVKEFLKRQAILAEGAGIGSECIAVDPGIGFGKTTRHNLEIIRNLGSFAALRKPLVVGTSRKGFLGKLTGQPVGGRLDGTIASVVACILNGASIVRVHDVAACKRAAVVADAIKSDRGP